MQMEAKREREREEDRRLVGGDAMGVDESLKRSGLAKVGGGWPIHIKQSSGESVRQTTYPGNDAPYIDMAN